MRTPRPNFHDEVLAPTGERLTMPLYGLGPAFTGDRRLLMWNGLTGEGPTGPDNPLWQVGLTHGTAHDAANVAVVTEAKLAGNGIVSAARTTQLCMIGILAARFPGELTALLEATRKVDEYAERIAEAPWSTVVAEVAGEPVPFRMRRMRAGWTAAADLGDVTIGVAGTGCDLTTYPIQPVRLADYEP